jgi:methionyl-tRNA formyltransferase
MIRTVVFAWCSGAEHVDALARAGAAPSLVVTGPSSDVSGALRSAAERAGAAWRPTDDPNDAALCDRIEALRPDLFVVAGCPRIFGARLLALPRLGALNVHPSLLPHYRGREPVFWALLRGERTVGVTVHRMTEDVDAGPILAQRALDVGPRATRREVVTELDRLGAALVEELAARALAGDRLEGTLPSEPGSAFPRLRPEHGLVDWSADAEELDRLVRASDGVVAAHAFVRGMRVVVLEAHALPVRAGEVSSRPGSITRIGDGALVVATGKGELALRRVSFVRTQSGEDLAAMLGLSIGDRFRSSPAL